MTKDYDRYFYASIVKHFTDNRDGITLYTEGQRRGVDNEYFELRIQDLNTEEVSKDQYRVDITINVLVSVDADNRDAYRIHDLTGIIRTAFEKTINIYKYGGDSSYLGCLIQQGVVSIDHFGNNKTNDTPIQAMVECGYTILLLGE